MLTLIPIELKDKIWIDPIVMAEHTESADFCFGNMFIWNRDLNQQIAKYMDRMIIRITAGPAPFFAFPIGSGPLEPVLKEMKAISDKEGQVLTIAGITTRHKQMMEELLPGAFEFQLEENYSDYIYDIESLSTLAGKKLHAKRNHINKFLSLYPDWRYEPLKRKYFADCMALVDKWSLLHGENEMEDSGETAAIKCAFNNYEALKFDGGVLLVNDTVCAFTLGEHCSPDTFLVHFEKADVEIEGAYTMINREFVRMLNAKYPELQSINRGDDMGLESLRKAKHSYKPFHQVEKYTARLK